MNKVKFLELVNSTERFMLMKGMMHIGKVGLWRQLKKGNYEYRKHIKKNETLNR